MSFTNDDAFIMSSGWFLIMNGRKRRNPRYWVSSLLRKRGTNGVEDLLAALSRDDVGLNGELRSSFHNFTRMSTTDFELLINLVGPKITKKNTNYRHAISVKERLAVTLRYLTTGDSFHSLKYLFKMSTSSISRIITNVYEALWTALTHNIKIPIEAMEWKEIAFHYNSMWNFPNCLGSMDGKHVVIQSPQLSGSEFFNYKTTFSIVLFAVVDASYNFIYIHVGSQGRISDGDVFKSTDFAKALLNTKLNSPPDSPLPGRTVPVPYFLVADDAFPLSLNIMKPFSGHQQRGSPNRIFNYRLSRARRIVENVFGILSSVFRVLHKPMLFEPEKAEKIVLACTCLHNFLRRNTQSSDIYSPPGSFDNEDLQTGTVTEGVWRHDPEPLRSLLPLRRTPRKSGAEAIAIRKEFCEYFTSEIGQVPWQDAYQ